MACQFDGHLLPAALDCLNRIRMVYSNTTCLFAPPFLTDSDSPTENSMSCADGLRRHCTCLLNPRCLHHPSGRFTKKCPRLPTLGFTVCGNSLSGEIDAALHPLPALPHSFPVRDTSLTRFAVCRVGFHYFRFLCGDVYIISHPGGIENLGNPPFPAMVLNFQSISRVYSRILTIS